MANAPRPVVLTIAGSDPSGGAGIQADLKTLHQHGVYGAAAITLLTVQNTRTVERVECLSPEFVARQIAAVVEDLRPVVFKTGALGTAETMEVVASAILASGAPVVVDPVMISKHGHALMPEGAVARFRDGVLPVAWVVTPNLHEAAALAGRPIETMQDAEGAAESIRAMGAPRVVIKGVGRLRGGSGDAADLIFDERGARCIGVALVETRHMHGSGCVFSAAIAAHLALGADLDGAVSRAKTYVAAALADPPNVGDGIGPLGLHAGVA